jgi:hypothetical protein
MADTFNNYLGTLNGIVGTKYAGKPENVIQVGADIAPLTNMISLESGQKLGLQYQFPLELTYDDSTTYAAAGAGAFSYNDTAPGQMVPALVNSGNYHQRGVIDYETIARTSDAPSAAEFESAVDRMMFRIDTGMAANLEVDFWYGGTNIGIVEAVTVGPSGSIPAGQARVTLTNASLAPLMWIARKGSRYDCYDLTDATGRPTSTKRNTLGALTLYSFDLANRYVYFTGAGADLAAIAVNDGFLKFGAYGNGTQGLDYVMTATAASPLLYTIDVTQYDLRMPNVKSNGGLALTLKRLYSHMSDAISKGVGTNGVDVWINPDNFGDLLANESVLKRYAEAGGQAKNGFSGLSYDSQVGKMTFRPFAGIKRSELFIGPTAKTCSKVGAAEPAMVNYGTGGGKDGTYLQRISGKAGCEAQKYGNLGFLNKRPGYWTKVTEIVPESAS